MQWENHLREDWIPPLLLGVNDKNCSTTLIFPNRVPFRYPIIRGQFFNIPIRGCILSSPKPFVLIKKGNSGIFTSLLLPANGHLWSSLIGNATSRLLNKPAGLKRVVFILFCCGFLVIYRNKLHWKSLPNYVCYPLEFWIESTTIKLNLVDFVCGW